MELPVIRDCAINQINQEGAPLSLRILTECMASQENPAEGEWAGQIISRQTVVYSCGMIGRAGETLAHHHSSSELELCRQLSQAAADIMADQFIGLGDEGDHELVPFYVTANEGSAAPVEIPVEITEATIRSAFGGTIDPQAALAIEPLEIGEQWWQEVAACCQEDEQTLAAWQNLVRWFAEHDLHHPVFVSISPPAAAEEASGGVLPRLALALTPAGSLVGLISCVVYT
jgi:hypothetical protein